MRAKPRPKAKAKPKAKKAAALRTDTPKKSPPRHAAPYRINLALQGGGAHGAFTWGVLDRLLEEEDVEIAGISGTSAGAMNAAVLVDGYKEGGRAGAKQRLYEFWYQISVEASKIAPFGTPATPDYFSDVPGLDWISSLNPFDVLTRMFSPYELNPLNYNPLRLVLEKVLDECSLHNGIPLFVAATNVETGEARVFREHEISIDVLLASACLPFLYQAVEIDGTPYWDGGYMGNPSIWPLIYDTDCHDVMLVQINPLKRAGTPKHAIDIINRVNEISFNASLIAEMRAINFVRDLIENGKLNSKEYKDIRMHRVMPPPNLDEMNAASKMNANWEFFEALHLVGRTQMHKWLKENKKAIGHKNTLDIKQHFLKKHPVSPIVSGKINSTGKMDA